MEVLRALIINLALLAGLHPGPCETRLYYSDSLPRTSCCCCSVAKLCPTLCGLMDCSMPGFSVLHYFPESFSMASISAAQGVRKTQGWQRRWRQGSGLCLSIVRDGKLGPTSKVLLFISLLFLVHFLVYLSCSFMELHVRAGFTFASFTTNASSNTTSNWNTENTQSKVNE